MTVTGAGERPNRAPVVALLTAKGLSDLGDIMTFVAVPWFVLQTTGSPALTGLAGFAATVPPIIAGVFGGAVVDRLGFKRASIIADVASALPVAMIPLLHLTAGIQFWQLLVLVFLSALLDTVGRTSRISLLPDLARLGDMPLERANSLNAVLQRFSLLIGPAAAGALIAFAGATNVLWVNAATFAISALIVAVAVPDGRRAPAEAGQPSRYLDELREGFRFLRADRLIFAMLLIIMVMNFIDSHLMVLLPVYADAVFGDARGFGLMVSSFGAGAVLGALLYGAVGHRLPRRGTFLAGFLGVAIPIWALTVEPPLPVTLGALALIGLIAAPLNPLINTIFQERTPEAMRGRVFGLIMAGAWLTAPFGRLLGGLLIEQIGYQATLILLAAAYLVAALSIFVVPALRDMGSRPDAAEPEAAPASVRMEEST